MTGHRQPRTKSRWPWIVVAAVVVVATAGVGVFVVLDSATPTATVAGTFALTDDATASAGCIGQGSDQGVYGGTSVILAGPDSKSIATTTLATGTASAGICTYRFQFTRTKTTLSTYTATVATQPPMTMTQSELKSNGWRFDIRFGPPTTTVTGSLELDDVETALTDCVGQGGYTDIEQGASVVITDQNNRILGSSALDAGTAGAAGCTYRFSVPDVRQDEQQYAVEVSHRGKVINSTSEMTSNGWTFDLTLGS